MHYAAITVVNHVSGAASFFAPTTTTTLVATRRQQLPTSKLSGKVCWSGQQ